MTDHADVDFFWDPVCPWAWLTSRWVAEVAALRSFGVDWRSISLRLLNKDKNYETDFPSGYPAIHGSGQKLLRVAAAVREAEGRGRMGELYTTFGGDIHVHRRRKEITDHYDTGLHGRAQAVAAGGAAAGRKPGLRAPTWATEASHRLQEHHGTGRHPGRRARRR